MIGVACRFRKDMVTDKLVWGSWIIWGPLLVWIVACGKSIGSWVVGWIEDSWGPCVFIITDVSRVLDRVSFTLKNTAFEVWHTRGNALLTSYFPRRRAMERICICARCLRRVCIWMFEVIRNVPVYIDLELLSRLWRCIVRIDNVEKTCNIVLTLWWSVLISSERGGSGCCRRWNIIEICIEGGSTRYQVWSWRTPSCLRGGIVVDGIMAAVQAGKCIIAELIEV